jgi:hypothetical protein
VVESERETFDESGNEVDTACQQITAEAFHVPYIEYTITEEGMFLFYGWRNKSVFPHPSA